MTAELLNADQLATLFSVTPATVRRWATRTADHAPCPHSKDGRGRLRFDPDLVSEWLDETGVGKRSRFQTQAAPPPPPVPMTTAIRWEPEHITTQPDLDDLDRDVLALHRTVQTCLHVCRNSAHLPDPPPNLDREQTLVWLLNLPHRPAEEWKRLARTALDGAGDEDNMRAVYG